LALMVCQIEARSNPLDKPRVDLTKEFLLKAYPPEHAVTLLWTLKIICASAVQREPKTCTQPGVWGTPGKFKNEKFGNSGL
jgi:hypothetical protein